jgi:hypothetical protein
MKAGCATKASVLKRTVTVVVARRCPICDELIERRDGERLENCVRRKTCGEETCVSKYASLVRTTTKLVDGRRCPGCSVLLEPRDGDSPCVFAKRMSCGDKACVRSLLRAARSASSPTFHGARISAAADLLAVSPDTVRNWQKDKLAISAAIERLLYGRARLAPRTAQKGA